MTKELLVSERELIHRLSLITGYGKDVVRDVIKAQTDFVLDELSNGIPVRIGNLGEFYISSRICNGGYDFAKKEVKPKKIITRVKFKCSRAVQACAKCQEG